MRTTAPTADHAALRAAQGGTGRRAARPSRAIAAAGGGEISDVGAGAAAVAPAPAPAPAAAEAPLAADLARRLEAAVPLVARVVVTRESRGWVALVHLDPLLVDARAGQQGLADRSVAAAAADARVQRLIADAVADVNLGCAPAQPLVGFSIVS